jgi:serine/threonine protein kinase
VTSLVQFRCCVVATTGLADVCMVFEQLGDNLLKLVKATRYRGVSLQTARALARRVTRALAFLHSKCGIIHTDLKPENVLLTHRVVPLPSFEAVRPLGTGDASETRAEDAVFDDTDSPSRHPRGGPGEHPMHHHSASPSPAGHSSKAEEEWISKELEGKNLSGAALRTARKRLRKRWKSQNELPPVPTDLPVAASSSRVRELAKRADMKRTGVTPEEEAPSPPVVRELAKRADMKRAGVAPEEKAPSPPVVRVPSMAGFAWGDGLAAWPGTRLWPLASASEAPGDSCWQALLGSEPSVMMSAEVPVESDGRVTPAWKVSLLEAGAGLSEALSKSAAEDGTVQLTSHRADVPFSVPWVQITLRVTRSEARMALSEPDVMGAVWDGSLRPANDDADSSDEHSPKRDSAPATSEERKEGSSASPVDEALLCSTRESWLLLEPVGTAPELGLSTLSRVLGTARSVGAGLTLQSLLHPATKTTVVAPSLPPPLPPGAVGASDKAVPPPPLPPGAVGASDCPSAAATAPKPPSGALLIRLKRCPFAPSPTLRRLCEELPGKTVVAEAWPVERAEACKSAEDTFEQMQTATDRLRLVPAAQAVVAAAAIDALEHVLPGLRISVAPELDERSEALPTTEDLAESVRADSSVIRSMDSFEAVVTAGETPDEKRLARVRALGAAPGSCQVPTLEQPDTPGVTPRAAPPTLSALVGTPLPDGWVPPSLRPRCALWGRMLVSADGDCQRPLSASDALVSEANELNSVVCLGTRSFLALVPNSAHGDDAEAVATLAVPRGAVAPDHNPSGTDGTETTLQWRPALERVLLGCSDVRWRNDGGRASDETAARARLGALRQAWEFRVRQMGAVVVDLGNACWVDRHFTEDVQTRQYRAPEVTLGAGYGTSADLWSMGCLLFELLTGDLLFDPRKGDAGSSGKPAWSREEDHIAQIIELLGPAPRKAAMRGRLSSDFFAPNGGLRRISQLRFWGPAAVLHGKYHMPLPEARFVESFLLELMAFDPEERSPASEVLHHPFVNTALTATSLALSEPEEWGWLIDGVDEAGQPTPETVQELAPLEQPASLATREEYEESDNGASEDQAGSTMGASADDDDALDLLTARLSAVRESLEDREVQAAVLASTPTEAEEPPVEDASESSALWEATLGLVAPLGQEAVQALVTGEASAPELVANALFPESAASEEEQEQLAFSRGSCQLAVSAVLGDAAAAEQVMRVAAGSGTLADLARLGIRAAQDYVRACYRVAESSQPSEPEETVPEPEPSDSDADKPPAEENHPVEDLWGDGPQ